MPIFYNFHILLATFNTIFGTNILIQCPVPVPVCCMLYVSQKPHIKRSPNGIKTNAETERDRETDPISEGLSPLPRHRDHGPEGKPFSHLGRRSRKKKKKGGSLPLASGGAGMLPGAIIITAIFTNTSAIFTNISITFSPLSTAVHSPATRCTLYLNMVLYASYYYPMMCCHPMMPE